MDMGPTCRGLWWLVRAKWMSRVMSSDVSTSLVLLPIFLIIFVVLEGLVEASDFHNS